MNFDVMLVDDGIYLNNVWLKKKDQMEIIKYMN